MAKRGEHWHAPTKQRTKRTVVGVSVLIVIVATLIVVGAAAVRTLVTRDTITPTPRPSAAIASATPEEPTTPIPPPVSGDGWVNDDYISPDVGEGPAFPTPDNEYDTERWRVTNPLYAHVMPRPVRCDVSAANPAWTSEQLASHLGAYTDCLMRAWDVPVRQAGFHLTRPDLVMVDDSIDTPCGVLKDIAGYYCAEIQTIYLWREHNPVRYDAYGQPIPALELTLAHEFGHHIQTRVGLLPASWLVQHHSGADEGLLESRRRELQAQCFAGMMLHAVAKSWNVDDATYEAIHSYEHREASHTHGTSDHQAGWFHTGYQGGTLASCNTWNSSPQDLA